MRHLVVLCAAVVLLGAIAFACGDDAAPPAPSNGAADASADAPASSEARSPDDGSAPDAPAAASRMVLDPSFGSGGQLVLSPALDDAGEPREVRGLVIQSSNAIVLAYGDPDVATTELVRVTAAGTRDASFGADAGVVVTNETFGLLVRSPGSDALVVAGTPVGAPGSSEIERFLPDGTPDPAFGTGGAAPGGAGGGIPVVQPDGKVLSGLSGGSIVNRLDLAGKLDPAFGSPAGYATLEPFVRYSLRALAVAPDGRIVGAGDVHDDAGADVDCVVVRLGADGSRDTSFGTAESSPAETLIADGCSGVGSVAVTSDGKILVRATTPGVLDLRLLRLTASGALDSSYLPPPSVSNPYSNVVQLPGDQLVFLASGLDQTAGMFGAWRIAAAGGADATFAPGGVRAMDERWGRGAFIGVQADGKLVVVGLLGSSLVVARYLP